MSEEDFPILEFDGSLPAVSKQNKKFGIKSKFKPSKLGGK